MLQSRFDCLFSTTLLRVCSLRRLRISRNALVTMESLAQLARCGSMVGRCRLKAVKVLIECAGNEALAATCVETLSIFASSFNLRRYSMESLVVVKCNRAGERQLRQGTGGTHARTAPACHANLCFSILWLEGVHGGFMDMSSRFSRSPL